MKIWTDWLGESDNNWWLFCLIANNWKIRFRPNSRGGWIELRKLFANLNYSWSREWKFFIQSIELCNSKLSGKQSIEHSGIYKS